MRLISIQTSQPLGLCTRTNNIGRLQPMLKPRDAGAPNLFGYLSGHERFQISLKLHAVLILIMV